jgi:ribosomal protein S6
MRTYELVMVLRPSLKDADVKKLLELVKGWIGDVTITKENDWGQKPLAYAIKKEAAGHYFQWMLETEEEKSLPADFEQRLIRHDDVLRHLVLRTK